MAPWPEGTLKRSRTAPHPTCEAISAKAVQPIRLRPYRSETERRAAFTIWLHMYNHHRGHTALGGLPPASRVTNLPGRYT
ncbi:transposase InsO family protein [Streptosporangium album]|uniref:Transposase InsO family protein n=1 Tax=Streptosporangium album TaxID=47479 RepID=A0A7W7S3U6_9ACTN|nr:transposase InsO family protein [Streptosporangium album]